MGKLKNYLLEIEAQASDRHIAKLLGITYEELTKLQWNLVKPDNDSQEDIFRIDILGNPPKEILDKIARLEIGNKVYIDEWELEAEYDFINDQFDAITQSKINLKTFIEELKKLKELSQLQSEGDKLKKLLNRQIFISIIGTMEAFLSDTFMNLVFDNKIYYQNFVLTHPEFGKNKFELREIFEKQKQLDDIVKKIILETLYHNLKKVGDMFSNTFEIEFPKWWHISKHVLIRHDLVHRNGKTKDGKEVDITDSQIDILIKDLIEFVELLCIELKIISK